MKSRLLCELLLAAAFCVACNAACHPLFQPIASVPDDVTLYAVPKDGSLARLPKRLRALNVARLRSGDFAHLVGFPDLEYLVLGPRYGNPQLTIEAVAALVALPTLRVVDASCVVGLSTDMLKAFGAIKGLKALSLTLTVGRFGDDPKISFDSLAWLLENSSIEELDVDSCKFTDEPTKFLASARKLKRLRAGKREGMEDLVEPALLAELPLQQLLLDCNLTQEVFNSIAKNQNLEVLELRGCKGVTAAGLKKLTACKKLHSLSVSAVEDLNDSCAAAIAELGGLRALDMSAPVIFNWTDEAYEFPASYSVTSACCESLVKMPALEVLRLSYCMWLDDAALTSLGKAKRLKVVDLEGEEPWTAKGIGALCQIATLEELHLDGEGNLGRSSVNDEVLAAVASATNLRWLAISLSAKVSAKGLAALSALKKLVRLDAAQCPWARIATLAEIGKITSLKVLYLHGCEHVDSAGLAQLKGLNELEELGLYACQAVADVACSIIGTFQKLKIVDLRYTGVSSKKAEELEEAGKSHGLLVIHY